LHSERLNIRRFLHLSLKALMSDPLLFAQKITQTIL